MTRPFPTTLCIHMHKVYMCEQRQLLLTRYLVVSERAKSHPSLPSSTRTQSFPTCKSTCVGWVSTHHEEHEDSAEDHPYSTGVVVATRIATLHDIHSFSKTHVQNANDVEPAMQVVHTKLWARLTRAILCLPRTASLPLRNTPWSDRDSHRRLRLNYWHTVRRIA